LAKKTPLRPSLRQRNRDLEERISEREAQLQLVLTEVLGSIRQLQQAFLALQKGLELRKILWRPVLTIRDMDEALHLLRERQTRQEGHEGQGEGQEPKMTAAPNPGPVQRFVEHLDKEVGAPAPTPRKESKGKPAPPSLRRMREGEDQVRRGEVTSE